MTPPGGGLLATLMGSWQLWAVLAALSAALTSLLAKLGLAGIDANLATFVRTLVVVVALAVGLLATGQLQGQHGCGCSAPWTGHGPAASSAARTLPWHTASRPPSLKLVIEMPVAASSTRLLAITDPSMANSE